MINFYKPSYQADVFSIAISRFNLMKNFEFYKVGYKYMDKQMYAVYFFLGNAQAAMRKMINNEVQVTGLESQKL